MTATFHHLQLQLSERYPLMPLDTATILTGRRAGELLAMVDSGEIGWAWDISHPIARHRSLVRLSTDAVLAYLWAKHGSLPDGSSPDGPTDGAPGPSRPTLDEETIYGGLFRHARAEIRSTELQCVLACGQFHVYNLIRSGCFEALNAAGHGPEGFVRVTRSSVINFLKQRRIL
jgi:hypothetical protein